MSGVKAIEEAMREIKELRAKQLEVAQLRNHAFNGSSCRVILDLYGNRVNAGVIDLKQVHELIYNLAHDKYLEIQKQIDDIGNSFERKKESN